MSQIPELWWLPASDELVVVREGMHHRYWAVSVFDDELDSARRWLPNLPDDAVRLVPEEPVDEKSRGEAYQRGFVDGRMAQRAHADALSVKRARPGSLPGYRGSGDAESMGDPPRLPSGALYDGPPFAPELADAPLVTGESGAPAPVVVDQPVHDSTLPAELEEGRGQ